MKSFFFLKTPQTTKTTKTTQTTKTKFFKKIKDFETGKMRRPGLNKQKSALLVTGYDLFDE